MISTASEDEPPMRFRLLDTMGSLNRGLCYLTQFVQGVERHSYRTHLGERLAPFYPKDARMTLSEEHPGVQLTSFIGNGRSMLIVSASFAEAVRMHCDAETEYLPVTICDHQGSPLSKDYFIINPIGTFDCLDLRLSDVAWSAKNSDRIIRIRDHVLDREKMLNAPQLFRVAESPSAYVIGRKLARELYDRRLTNVFWTELPFADEVQTPTAEPRS